jgi:hypothetical protein
MSMYFRKCCSMWTHWRWLLSFLMNNLSFHSLIQEDLFMAKLCSQLRLKLRFKIQGFKIKCIGKSHLNGRRLYKFVWQCQCLLPKYVMWSHAPSSQVKGIWWVIVRDLFVISFKVYVLKINLILNATLKTLKFFQFWYSVWTLLMIVES